MNILGIPFDVVSGVFDCDWLLRSWLRMGPFGGKACVRFVGADGSRDKGTYVLIVVSAMFERSSQNEPLIVPSLC